MKLIEDLQWRYATKAFDPNRKVTDKDLDQLKEAIRLSVSSYGLQSYKVLIIENNEVRHELRKASWDQQQITDASHLFVFCNHTTDFNKDVDDYIDRIATAQGSRPDQLVQYGEFIKTKVNEMPATERKSWSEKQTYIALNNLLIACAALRIDACPMEGFDNAEYNRILGLDDLGLNASVIAPVGYRAAIDPSQHWKKIRKTTEELFEMA